MYYISFFLKLALQWKLHDITNYMRPNGATPMKLNSAFIPINIYLEDKTVLSSYKYSEIIPVVWKKNNNTSVDELIYTNGAFCCFSLAPLKLFCKNYFQF